jgi:hypothetical protein
MTAFTLFISGATSFSIGSSEGARCPLNWWIVAVITLSLCQRQQAKASAIAAFPLVECVQSRQREAHERR